jgi:CheY-like chemotaxis protein
MNRKTILLVEDDPSDADLTRRALKGGKIANDLVVAADGQEAIDYLFGLGAYAGRDTSALPALTLLDMKLPKLSGLDVLRKIRAETLTRRIPVVILTSSREEQDIAASYDLGVNSYIRKPVDFEQFVQAVAHLELYWLILNEEPPVGLRRGQPHVPAGKTE